MKQEMNLKAFGMLLLFFLLVSGNAIAPSCNWLRVGYFGTIDRVLSLVSSGNSTIVAGTGPYGDVLRSTDNGNSWQSAGKLGNATRVNCLVTASDGTILAGTAPNGEIFKSTDGGASWSSVGSLSSGAIVGIARNNSTLYALADALPDAKLFKSTDNGNSWTDLGRVTAGSNMYNPKALAVGKDGTIYAGGKYAWTNNGGIYRSTNDGSSWTAVELIGSEEVVSLLAASNGTVYAGTKRNGTVYVSHDNGASWLGSVSLPGAEAVQSLFEASNGIVYAGTMWNAEVFRTTLGSASWESVGRLANAMNVYGFAEANDTGIIAGTRPESDIFKMLCVNFAPVANAGNDQTVEAGETVVLDGSNSFDPDGDPMAFTWTYVSGRQLQIDFTDIKRPYFTAVEENDVYVFQLVVRDNGSPPKESEPVTVTVRVKGECNEGETEECITQNGCTGSRTCGNGFWGDCVAESGICEPGNKIPCSPTMNGEECKALSSWRYCDACGMAFGDCNSSGFECCPGEQKQCIVNNCNGTHVCGPAGLFEECLKTDPSCGMETSCGEDKDCMDDEKCEGGKCKLIECPPGMIPKNHDCNQVGPKEEALYYLEKAQEETRKDNLDKAILFLDKAKQIAQGMKDDRLLGYINNAIGAINGGNKIEGENWILKAVRYLLGQEGEETFFDIVLQQTILGAVAIISAIGLVYSVVALFFAKKPGH